mgnify:CR=1 FL=1
MDVQFPVFVRDGDFLRPAGEGAGDVDAPALEDAAAEGKPPGGVVVARDYVCGATHAVERGQEFVEGGHGALVGYVAVVDVAGDDEGVGVMGIDGVKDLAKDVSLVLKHRHTMDVFPYVEVGGVDESHGSGMVSASIMFIEIQGNVGLTAVLNS